MQMPESVTQILIEHRNSIWSAFVTLFCGANGGYVAVLISEKEMSPKEARATVFIGAVMAFGFSSIVGELIDVSFDKSIPIAGTALATGILGRPIARRIFKMGSKSGGEE